MKGKYITLNILMACARKRTPKKSIHDQLEQTIAERKMILQQLEKFTHTARTIEMILNNNKAA